jgi:MYXO-CTERM domain-containing protein
MPKSTLRAALLVVLGVSTTHAQGLTQSSKTAADAGDEVTQLMQVIEQTAINLSTCDDACRALGTMQRASDRICALEPDGPRCDSARAKTSAARVRVLSACPTCTLEEPHVARAVQPSPPAEATKASGAGTTAVDNAPRRGGCAGCASASTDGDYGWAIALAAFVLSQRRRRRR